LEKSSESLLLLFALPIFLSNRSRLRSSTADKRPPLPALRFESREPPVKSRSKKQQQLGKDTEKFIKEKQSAYR